MGIFFGIIFGMMDIVDAYNINLAIIFTKYVEICVPFGSIIGILAGVYN